MVCGGFGWLVLVNIVLFFFGVMFVVRLSCMSVVCLLIVGGLLCVRLFGFGFGEVRFVCLLMCCLVLFLMCEC